MEMVVFFRGGHYGSNFTAQFSVVECSLRGIRQRCFWDEPSFVEPIRCGKAAETAGSEAGRGTESVVCLFRPMGVAQPP